MNEALEKLEIDKIPRKAASDKKMIDKKIDEVGEVIRNKLRTDPPLSVGDIVVKQMKEEFKTMEKNYQYRVLTLMPRDRTVDFLKTTFEITEHQAKRAKSIQAEQGILLTPTPKPGRRLP